MVVKIRLARFGKRHAPFYNIVVMNARTARNSKPIEVIGTYDPIPKKPERDAPEGSRPHKDIQLDISRAKYWLGVGAQPTEPIHKMLAMIGLMQPRFSILQRQAAAAKARQMYPTAAQKADAEAQAQSQQDADVTSETTSEPAVAT